MSDYNINKMDFKQLRNEVQLLRDELAIMKRKYEDLLYNLDTDNFSQRIVKQGKDMYTKIEQTAEEITLQAEKVEDNSSKIGKLTVSAEKIESEVFDENGNSKIEQTAEQIRTIVFKSANLDEAEEISFLDEAKDTTKTYVIRSDTGETYYYYNEISNEWEVLSGDSIYSVFEQTGGGFALKGNVLIDGDLVTTENLKLTGTVTWDMDNSPVKTEYSVDGVSWHEDQDTDDIYIRMSFDGGHNWNTPTQIVGSDAAVPSYIQSTHIDGARIMSPKIWGGKFYATGQGRKNEAAYYICNGYHTFNGEPYLAATDLRGYISYDEQDADITDDNGNVVEAKERVFFTTNDGVALKLQSGGNMSLSAGAYTDSGIYDGTIHFMSYAWFHGGTNLGSGDGSGTATAVFA